jgi:hypothetical protein
VLWSANFKPIELYFSLQLFVDRTIPPAALATANAVNAMIDNDNAAKASSLWDHVGSYLWSPSLHVQPYLPPLSRHFNVTVAMRGADQNVG